MFPVKTQDYDQSLQKRGCYVYNTLTLKGWGEYEVNLLCMYTNIYEGCCLLGYNASYSGKTLPELGRKLQGRIYSFGCPGEIKMWRPLSATTNFGYDISFFL
jgi:hypothetical protein